MANHKHSDLWRAIQACKAIPKEDRKIACNYIAKVERFCRAYKKNHNIREVDYNIGAFYKDINHIPRDIYRNNRPLSEILAWSFPWDQALVKSNTKPGLFSNAVYAFWHDIKRRLENQEAIQKEASKLKKDIRSRKLNVK